MSYGRRPRRSPGPTAGPGLDSALDAMTAEELRSFIRDVLERLDDEPRRQLEDALLLRAAKESSTPKAHTQDRFGFVHTQICKRYCDGMDVLLPVLIEALGKAIIEPSLSPA